MDANVATWSGGTERLDRVVADLGLARSRSRAAEFIAAGRVSIDGAVTRKTGARVVSGSRVEVDGADRYASRAAHKLIAGLDRFGIDATGRLALDLGASTGGFTEVLLERGAREVLALDVGHDQLVPELRSDARVRVVEGCNARDLTPRMLAELTGTPEAPGLVVADLSFISLTLVLPAIAAVCAPAADLVLLVKPQFEVGRSGLRDGIVADAALAEEAVRRVVECAESLGLRSRGLAPSPITGEHGNQEFLAYFEKTGEQIRGAGDA